MLSPAKTGSAGRDFQARSNLQWTMLKNHSGIGSSKRPQKSSNPISLYNITPIYISWFIGKARNVKIFEGRLFAIEQVWNRAKSAMLEPIRDSQSKIMAIKTEVDLLRSLNLVTQSSQPVQIQSKIQQWLLLISNGLKSILTVHQNDILD